jgi:transcriptional regulator with XRE-family HTH domain
VLDEHGRPIRERIRTRRQEQELTASELARRAGISPAYMTRIEKGEKVPGEEVAVALALALGDDPQLYLAWIHGRYFSDPESTLEGLQRVSYRGGPSSPRMRIRMEREVEERRLKELTARRRELEEEIEQRARKHAELERRIGEQEEHHRDLERRIEEQSEAYRKADEAVDVGAVDEGSEDLGAHPALHSIRSASLRRHASRLRSRMERLEVREDAPPSVADLAEAGAILSEQVTFSSDSYPGAPLLAKPEAPLPFRVAVFDRGVDPGPRPDRSEEAVDRVWFDPGLLPGPPRNLFAYRVSAEELGGDPAGPGALVILTRTVQDPPDPERLYAVRTPRSEKRAADSGFGPVYLTRVRRNDDTLIVFPPGMGTDVEIVELGKKHDLTRILVGEVLATVRRGPGQPAD